MSKRKLLIGAALALLTIPIIESVPRRMTQDATPPPEPSPAKKQATKKSKKRRNK